MAKSKQQRMNWFDSVEIGGKRYIQCTRLLLYYQTAYVVKNMENRMANYTYFIFGWHLIRKNIHAFVVYCVHCTVVLLLLSLPHHFLFSFFFTRFHRWWMLVCVWKYAYVLGFCLCANRFFIITRFFFHFFIFSARMYQNFF